MELRLQNCVSSRSHLQRRYQKHQVLLDLCKCVYVCRLGKFCTGLNVRLAESKAHLESFVRTLRRVSLGVCFEDGTVCAFLGQAECRIYYKDTCFIQNLDSKHHRATRGLNIWLKAGISCSTGKRRVIAPSWTLNNVSDFPHYSKFAPKLRRIWKIRIACFQCAKKVQQRALLGFFGSK